MGQVQAQMAEHGFTCFAWHQNSGRGQRGKAWQTEPGMNLTMSVVIEPEALGVSRQFYLGMAVALAAADFILEHAQSHTCIKWPNDIYWRDRKAGGILIENVLKGSEWKYAIVGIGLNINQPSFDASLINPVSLKQITGKQFDVRRCADELLANLEERWQQLVQGRFAEVLGEYNDRLYKLNEKVTLKAEQALITTTVLGVKETGELLVDTGSVTEIPFGSVEWVIR